jgi:hypothetical protein
MDKFRKLCEAIEGDWVRGIYETYEEALAYMEDHIEWAVTTSHLTQEECLDIIYMNN